jgi:hypothetical protein
VRLKGRTPNTFGIGALVRVLGGPVPLQSREMTAGGLYLSSSDPLLSFAAGTGDSLVVEVTWRDGSRSRIPDARPNRIYEVDQAGALPAAGAAAAPPPPDSAPPLFADLTDRLVHRHIEVFYDDAARQPLLPNSFAQLGPGASWLDLDGDGRDELLVAAGKTGRTGVFQSAGARFLPLDLGLPAAAGDQTTILQVPDGRGGSELLIGQSSYEAESAEAGRAMPSVIAVPLDARGRRAGPIGAAIPGDTAAIGPLALADYDQDGDLDLFVGGRIFPGAYPLSPSSRLYKNDGTGRFVLDSANTEVLRHLGMVTAALFSDLDQDGDPDLVVAIEWGPVKVLWNDHGRLVAGPTWGLDRYYSRWLGLASGDFDGDGRPDLVVTSWGRNLRVEADSARPLLLYFGNFDSDATLDLLPARYDPRLKGLAPLAGFARLSRAVPDIARRLVTFHAYADATVEQVLGPEARPPRVLHLGVNTFDHLVWLNRGDHFEPDPLPLEAQFAPAFAPVVADFDGDGIDDLVLSQNFFPTDLGTPRYDAGRALLLRGNGTGGFTPVSGRRSGLMVYGDQRGAAASDYDGDGRVDVVITQNGAATRLYRNQGARPGLRVGLVGPPGNPRAIGASVRLEYGERRGPLREVQAGSGYWSVNGSTQILGLREEPTGVLVRWPDGRTSEAAVPAGARELRISHHDETKPELR